VTSSGIDRVHSFDPESGLIFIDFQFNVSQGGVDFDVVMVSESGFAFRQQEDESWLAYGNRRTEDIDFTMINEREYLGSETATVTPHMRIEVSAAEGTLDAVDVRGVFPPNDEGTTVNLVDTAGENGDEFQGGTGDIALTVFPDPAATFDIDVTRDGELAPTTFPVESVHASFVFSSLAGSSQTVDFDELANDAQSVTTTVPQTIQDSFVTTCEIRVEILGPSGQGVAATETFNFLP